MTPHASAWLLVVALGASGCATQAGPVAVEPGRDSCASCRMAFASTSTAVEIVRPGDEPVLFDDIICFRQYAVRTAIPADATIWLTDHLTGDWVEAARAIVTASRAGTPMGSGLLAHASAEARDRDPAAAGGTPVALETLRP